MDEARVHLRTAQELDPFSASINTSAIWPEYWARRGDEAVRGFQAAVDLHPGYWVAHYYLALAHAIRGDPASAILSARQAEELGDSPWKYGGVGYVYAKAGQHVEAEKVLAKLDEAGRRQYVSPIHAAAIHAGLGNPDEALSLLNQAAEAHDWHIAWLDVDLFWDEMREDSRFLDLLRRTIHVQPLAHSSSERESEQR